MLRRTAQGGFVINRLWCHFGYEVLTLLNFEMRVALHALIERSNNIINLSYRLKCINNTWCCTNWNKYLNTDYCKWSRTVATNCALLAYYAACSGNSLPTFRDNLPVPSSRAKNPRSLKMGQTGPPETSLINYQYTLRNSPEERSTQLFRCRKSGIISHWAIAVKYEGRLRSKVS